MAEKVATHPEITPYGYGVMHLEPLFNTFPFDDLGGPWADLPPDARRRMERGSLPVSERIHDTCFWLSTPVDPNPEWGGADRGGVSQGGESRGTVCGDCGGRRGVLNSVSSSGGSG